MSPALINFIATGNFLGIGCGSSSADVDRHLGLSDSTDFVELQGGVELRRIYGAGAMTIFVEREAVSGIGLYWGSENVAPAALRNAGIDTQSYIALQEFNGVLSQLHLSFERYEDGRILLIRRPGIVAFTEDDHIGSVVKPCPGSLCLADLVYLEPALTDAVFPLK